jgi:hypothetical protein
VPPRIPAEKKNRYIALRAANHNITEAAKAAGVSRDWASDYERGRRRREGALYYAEQEELKQPAAKTADKLSPDAQRALEDFSFFRHRYFGRRSVPWQEQAAHKMVELLAAPEESFLVVNVPPGGGKSTAATDFVLWVLCRERATRVLYGSRTETQATMYTRRIRAALERTDKVRASSGDIKRGLASDAEAVLLSDFGRFKPQNPDLWRSERFVISQPGEVVADDKEASVAAFGMDSGVLGGRYDLNIWDDLVDSKNLRTAESREKLQNFWESIAETRVEPGGLVALVGQRLDADDLYRYALDLAGGDVEVSTLEDHIGGDPEQEYPRKYHHIKFQAHDDGRCQSRLANPDHALDARPWTGGDDGGCLLDPKRLSWKKLQPMMLHRAERFEVVYQQEDIDPSTSLVAKDWIEGGQSSDGEYLPGCKDLERDLWELPKGLAGLKYAYITADPSPTKYWAIMAWVYHPLTGQRFLLDVRRQAMAAPDFLEFDSRVQHHTGLLEEWWTRFDRMGVPLTHVFVEQNAAQRFLLQYQFVQDWKAKRGVRIIGHDTHRNKSHPEYGIQMLAGLYLHGLVRLPWRGKFAQLASMKLIAEVTKWPHGGTDDCVMSQWFGEYNLPRFFREETNVVSLRPNDIVAQHARRGMARVTA